MIGLVIKKQASGFDILAQKQVFACSARGNLKDNGVFVGDNVEFDETEKQIKKVLPRKNKLVRPPLANLDKLVILITHTPEPDFLLLDKLLLFCYTNGIEPIVCHSKSDLGNEGVKYLKSTYGKFVEVVEISSFTGKGVEGLKKMLKNKISAVAGQSGVGKSALINAITGKLVAQTGELSEKIARGKQTTRHSELFQIAPNSFLADTAGFSSLDEKFLDVDFQDLPKYYPDFTALLQDCKFSACTHTHEPNCAVKNAIAENKIDRGRYERYLAIFNTLKNKNTY